MSNLNEYNNPESGPNNEGKGNGENNNNNNGNGPGKKNTGQTILVF